MKTNKIFITALSLFVFTFISCEMDILDKNPRDSFTDTVVWEDMNLVRMFSNSTYNGLVGANRDWSFGGSFGWPGSDSDLLLANYGGGGQEVINLGTISPESMGAWNEVWGRKYEYIRRVNIFLQNSQALMENNEREIKILQGEMKFLRAYLYYQLIRYFGGVPLITEPFELDDDFNVARTPYEELVDWIVKELDEAREMLPEGTREFGRAHRAACLALKSNMLLHANSKLHHPGTEPSGPLYNYTKNTWQEVANAAKAVIDDPRFSLQEANDFKDYSEIFITVNPEIIFGKANNPDYGLRSVTFYAGPPGMPWQGWGNYVPLHNWVQEFQMSNGMSINEPGSGYDPAPETIYENREMRFYANILYQGAFFEPREMDFANPNGMDFPAQVPYREDASRTGYNFRKFLVEGIDPSTRRKTPQILMRLAEMYLNYAEAQYFMGNETEARKYINIIRNRVHLPDINTSGEELFKDLQYERKMELAMEHHRFFDIRRWMIADKYGNIDATGIFWQRLNSAGDLDPDGELTYEIRTVENRIFHERNYYLPIPRTEIERSGLEQNFGYN